MTDSTQTNNAPASEICLVHMNADGDECGQQATGKVYDETDQRPVPSCARHVTATARGRVADYRPLNPASV